MLFSFSFLILCFQEAVCLSLFLKLVHHGAKKNLYFNNGMCYNEENKVPRSPQIVLKCSEILLEAPLQQALQRLAVAMLFLRHFYAPLLF